MKALLVVADYFDIDYDLNESIEELKKLTIACHMQVENIVVQHIHKKTPQYYIGKGKVEEIALMIDDVDIVIFNEELTPLQMKNLSDIFLKEVSDRSDLILRIFETRAKTKEAKLQVKIARSEYMLPRIAGMRKDIYSQQGGMGFRGSGEKQIELDKRLIRKHFASYQKELELLVSIRDKQL